jgi:uncharacterized repeat protein (TIGR02543 family)
MKTGNKFLLKKSLSLLLLLSLILSNLTFSIAKPGNWQENEPEAMNNLIRANADIKEIYGVDEYLEPTNKNEEYLNVDIAIGEWGGLKSGSVKKDLNIGHIFVYGEPSGYDLSRNEFRYAGQSMEGDNFSNFYFKPDALTASLRIDERKWIKDPWTETNDTLISQFISEASRFRYNNLDPDSNYRKIIRESIVTGLINANTGFLDVVFSSSNLGGGTKLTEYGTSPEETHYIEEFVHIVQPPTLSSAGFGMMFHVVGGTTYYWDVPMAQIEMTHDNSPPLMKPGGITIRQLRNDEEIISTSEYVSLIEGEENFTFQSQSNADLFNNSTYGPLFNQGTTIIPNSFTEGAIEYTLEKVVVRDGSVLFEENSPTGTNTTILLSEYPLNYSGRNYLDVDAYYVSVAPPGETINGIININRKTTTGEDLPQPETRNYTLPVNSYPEDGNGTEDTFKSSYSINQNGTTYTFKEVRVESLNASNTKEKTLGNLTNNNGIVEFKFSDLGSTPDFKFTNDHPVYHVTFFYDPTGPDPVPVLTQVKSEPETLENIVVDDDYEDRETETYEVRFLYINGNIIIPTQEVEGGKAATPPSFDQIPKSSSIIISNPPSWTSNPLAQSINYITQNTDFTVSYVPAEFIVNFIYEDDQGIQEILKTQTVGYEQSATAPSPIKFYEGYEFVSWDPEDFSSIKNDLNVFANYQEKSNQVTFNPNGGTLPQGFEGVQSIPNYGFVDEPSEGPTRSGFTFLGWFKNSSNFTEGNVFNFDERMTEEKVIYAGWMEDAPPPVEPPTVEPPTVEPPTVDPPDHDCNWEVQQPFNYFSEALRLRRELSGIKDQTQRAALIKCFHTAVNREYEIELTKMFTPRGQTATVNDRTVKGELTLFNNYHQFTLALKHLDRIVNVDENDTTHQRIKAEIVALKDETIKSYDAYLQISQNIREGSDEKVEDKGRLGDSIKDPTGTSTISGRYTDTYQKRRTQYVDLKNSVDLTKTPRSPFK